MKFHRKEVDKTKGISSEYYDVSGCDTRRDQHANGLVVWVMKPYRGKNSFIPTTEVCFRLEKERIKILNMARYFEIKYAYVDAPKDYLYATVKSTDVVIEEEDDHIFYYGLSEEEIRKAIETGEPVGDFFIYDYQEQI